MDPLFSENFTETMAEGVAAIDQKFHSVMVAEIKRNFESARVLVDQYNTEFDLLKEVVTKSFSVKIEEVREDERKISQAALKQQALEHLKKEEEALKKLESEHENNLKMAEEALHKQDLEHQAEVKKAAEEK